MTGTLDLDADLSASGPADALARTARGTFQLTARDGQIQRAPAHGAHPLARRGRRGCCAPGRRS